ncbi:PIN domain-containing protein [Phenylobacterium sp.]|uniref:PIN domain-containing protein n=1 Tax=Phenylobacterium sp. TaxID=1871053 RepID=UPI002734F60B|nr:PIN domain-containing protein [Phenylobacterium sp.]
MADAFFDANILVYLLTDDAEKASGAEALVHAGGVISVQVLNEFAHVALRKLQLPWPHIVSTLEILRSLLRVTPLTLETHLTALEIAQSHRLGIFDAQIVAAARGAGCSTLYSEDMHSGLTVGGVTLVNPFAATA